MEGGKTAADQLLLQLCADRNCDARWSCSFNERRWLFRLCVALALTSGNSTAFNQGILSDRSQQ